MLPVYSLTCFSCPGDAAGGDVVTAQRVATDCITAPSADKAVPWLGAIKTFPTLDALSSSRRVPEDRQHDLPQDSVPQEDAGISRHVCLDLHVEYKSGDYNSGGSDPALAGRTAEAVGEQACILVWVLAVEEQSDIEVGMLESFHMRIEKHAEMFRANILTQEAIFGMLRGQPVPEKHMTAEDCCVRLGHLLVRWAASQKLGVRVGVHRGVLRHLVLPGPPPRDLYFGSACSVAFELALNSVDLCVVHLSKEVKAQLSALRTIRVNIGAKGAGFYLLPNTAVKNFFDGGYSSVEKAAPTTSPPPPSSQSSPALRSSLSMAFRSDGGGDLVDQTFSSGSVVDVAKSFSVGKFFSTMGRPESLAGKGMSMEDFSNLLTKHGVDVSKFGKGAAKSFEKFHRKVTIEEANLLVARPGGGLLRYVTIVRIMLRCRTGDDKLTELRIKTQTTADGGVRTRDQPLAIVLCHKGAQAQDWQDAVTRCLETKLMLTPKVQKALLRMDMQTYCFKEETSVSDTVPDVLTTYRSHNIVIDIVDPHARDLRKIGLPKGDEFSLGNGQGKIVWNWAAVTNMHEEELMNLLQTSGLDIKTVTPQAFAELYDEVYQQRTSTLCVEANELIRTVRVLKVWLRVDILNVDYSLAMRAKFQKGHFDDRDKDRPLSMRLGANHDWEDGIEELLVTRLGIASKDQREHMRRDLQSQKESEELGYSRSFPGLKTKYLVHEVHVVVRDIRGEWCKAIGLPEGNDFSFSRSEGDDSETVTHWCWKLAEDVFANASLVKAVGEIASDETVWAWDDKSEMAPEMTDAVSTMSVLTGRKSEEDVFTGRVPSPEMLVVPKTASGSVAALFALMSGRRCQIDRAINAATKIRDADYCCKMFFEDVTAAFPELRLYCVGGADGNKTSSGRTPDDEYQRTICALFALYWLMRLDFDGKEAFCFGVDAKSSKWRPRKPQVRTRSMEETAKRAQFFANFDWQAVQRLLVDAGFLKQQGDGFTHDKGRTLAMLVLMAIHDIMKVTVLLPKVSKEVKKFHGKAVGETIVDHDQALSYVLEHHPLLLPSFAALDKAQQESVKFTHCKLDYNMGWLVQAEAPPAMLFGSFRQAITSGNAKEADVAFYFVHWFCDLAGAEPCPLEGCEKFVLKFPLKVLRMFLESFAFVQGLGKASTETQVLERYLAERWEKHEPRLGPVPEGGGAVARMRLLLAAQDGSERILQAFDTLGQQDLVVLSTEMALTGRSGQSYRCDTTKVLNVGPAFLVYYGPALLQKLGKKSPDVALLVLAEVYRQARALWPFAEADKDTTVTLRIDALKELDATGILQPEPSHFWLLVKEGPSDAVVNLASGHALATTDWKKAAMLMFSPSPRKEETPQRKSLQHLVKKLHGLFW